MIDIAIVDDNIWNLAEVDTYISSFFQEYEYTTHRFTNEVEFLGKIKKYVKFDIIILDIMLPTISGLSIGKLVNKFLPKASIIFISANPDYFKDVYYVDHMCFLTKPIEKKRLKDAIFRSLEKIRCSFICVAYKGVLEKIYFDDIIFIESSLRNVIFHLSDGKQIAKFEKISNIEPELPSCFVRCQKSYIINLEHINKIITNKIFTSTKQNITISRTKINEVKQKYALYLGGEL